MNGRRVTSEKSQVERVKKDATQRMDVSLNLHKFCGVHPHIGC